MSSCTLKAEDGIVISQVLVEVEFPELEGLDFHRVADKLSRGFDLDDGVISSHIIENG